MRIRSRDGDSVLSLLYRSTGRSDDAAIEALYDANPHIISMGPILMSGVEIDIPEFEELAPVKVVNVWD